MSEDERHDNQPKLVKQTSDGNKLALEVELSPGSEVEVQYSYMNEKGEKQTTKTTRVKGIKSYTKHKLAKLFKSPTRVAFVLALLVYLLVRVVAIEDFPIFFFSDEAIQTVLAADLVRDQFHSPYGELLPTFFMNGGQYNLGVSVYAQVLPLLVFGKAIWVTRLTGVLVSLIAALAIGWLIEHAFHRKIGWLAILVLSLMPAWFLHSRTAFETSLAVSFYAGLIFCYMLYRLKKPQYLFGAVIFSALAFYSYSPARVYVGITLLGLFLSDLKFHWQQRRTFVKAFILGLLFIIPFVRFSLNYPGESIRHLEILGSYWVQNISFGEKVSIFLQEYLRGLNPYYWFVPNQVDLERHLMKGYGHLWQPAMPFVIIGLIWCVKNIKLSFARLVLIAILAAPSGAALAGLGITRTLVMVIPVTLLATIGLKISWGWVVDQTNQYKYRWRNLLSSSGIIMFAILTLLNVRMAVDALVNGPTWFNNYGLYGMQYGAKQVFGEIEEELKNDPNQKFYLTSAWANGADVLSRFFFDDPIPFQMGSIDTYINEFKPLDGDTVFIMIQDELERMQESEKFTKEQIQKIIHYPNGEPGFYFVKSAYVDNIEEIFVDEQMARRTLKEGVVTLQDGEEVQVAYSTLDMGEIFHIFDGDRTTLARTWEANPLRIVIQFSQPREIESIRFRVGGEATRIEVELWEVGKDKGIEFSRDLKEEADPRYAEIDLNEKLLVKEVEVRVTNLNNQEPAHVHLWEVKFYPLRP